MPFSRRGMPRRFRLKTNRLHRRRSMFPGRATCEPYRAEHRFAGNRSATFEWAAQRYGFGDPPQIDAERAVPASLLGVNWAPPNASVSLCSVGKARSGCRKRASPPSSHFVCTLQRRGMPRRFSLSAFHAARDTSSHCSPRVSRSSLSVCHAVSMPSAASRPKARIACSRSLNFWILPEAVIGYSLTNWM